VFILLDLYIQFTYSPYASIENLLYILKHLYNTLTSKLYRHYLDFILLQYFISYNNKVEYKIVHLDNRHHIKSFLYMNDLLVG